MNTWKQCLNSDCYCGEKRFLVCRRLMTLLERFELKVPIPITAVGNGSNSLVVCSSENDDILAKIHVVAGNILDHEIVAELQILREELDLLKKAFRRHASGS